MVFHVELAGVLFVIWGAMITLIGLSTLALGVASASLVNLAALSGGQFAARVMATAFTTLATLAIAWGGAHIAVGFPLRRHRHWSRLAALMLGAVDLLLLPYGTALGCYALWALLHHDGRKLFTES